MEDITINQKQLFDVIKRTMSFSKEYAIEKLDADGNFIVFINGDFTDFFILSKSLVDYISTKSSAYSKLQETYIKFTESANARAKELFKREDEIKSLKEELKSLRDENKCKSYAVTKAIYDELYKNHEDLISDHNKVIDEYKGLQTNYIDLKHEYEEILKEHDSYKNDELNKIYEADRNLNVQLKTYKAEIRNLKDNLDQVNDLCEERERIINECNQKIIDYEAIIKDLKKANEYYIRKENCATPAKECDDHDSSYPPTKVK